MTHTKPFYRTHRPLKQGPNSPYSSSAYIRDPLYAKNAHHYVRAFLLIQQDLQSIFEYVEPSDECRAAYSYRIHALFMRTCIEVEANFKAILEENLYTPPARLTMEYYRKLDDTHHLSSYEVKLPIWNGVNSVFKPFEPWKNGRGNKAAQNVGLAWYQAYNKSKHDRHVAFKSANLENLVNAVSGLLVLLTAQFKDEDFSAAATGLTVDGYSVHDMEPATGSLFRINYPSDWSDAQMYEFDWTELSLQADRFQQIDFDQVLV